MFKKQGNQNYERILIALHHIPASHVFAQIVIPKAPKQQQQMGINGGIVMDGRDIGTVVFPCADIKLFVTAKPEVRAKRRLDELTEKGSVTTFNEVLNNISKRDHIDTSREDSPLKMADDAILLDNSLLTREEQLQFAINLVNTKLNQTA